ncbi:MAG TPA: nucleotidyltransferase family protein [Pyrinomonadaceae bacterium]|nr:nucleotidyltransferase family protein [Pyrinomonadaceae bacterium]
MGYSDQRSKIDAVVLAAGQSLRMGALKPLLPFGAKSVISTCINNLRDAGIDEIVVVVGHRASEITQHLKDENVAFAVNDDPQSEMGASIARGVEAISSDATAILISPADIPGVAAGTISSIISAWNHGARLVIPEHEGRGGHPVLIDARFRKELLTLDHTAGLRGFFRRHLDEVLRFAVESPYIARDLDTWDDYRRLHEEIFGLPPAKQD